MISPTLVKSPLANEQSAPRQLFSHNVSHGSEVANGRWRDRPYRIESQR